MMESWGKGKPLRARSSGQSVRRGSWDFCFSPEIKTHFIHQLKGRSKLKAGDPRDPSFPNLVNVNRKEELTD